MRLKSFNIAFGSQIFKALSDESRIRILHLLFLNKTLTISDLELILDFTQTKTARHIAYLKNAGIVASKKLDQWAFYYIKEEGFDILSQIFSYLTKDQTLINDQEVFETLRSNRELASNKIDKRKWKLD